MKFTKFGKALLMGALSAGVVFGISSCVVSYTVGYLYITGTETAQPSGAGIISGYRIDHNTGQLANIDGLPVSSVEQILCVPSCFPAADSFMFSIVAPKPQADSSIAPPQYPCQGSNIAQFAVGGNGILTPQETFYHRGH